MYNWFYQVIISYDVPQAYMLMGFVTVLYWYDWLLVYEIWTLFSAVIMCNQAQLGYPNLQWLHQIKIRGHYKIDVCLITYWSLDENDNILQMTFSVYFLGWKVFNFE